MLIDTHCHINMIIKKKFDVQLTQDQLNDAEKTIAYALDRGVTAIINVGTSLVESINCIQLANKYPNCFATVGLHPNDCTKNWEQDFIAIKSLLDKDKENLIIGIGECGIDLHYPGYDLERQQQAFRAHIELALERNMALVVHSRDAQSQTIEILNEYRGKPLRGVMHCFSGSISFAQQAIELGLMIGIDGPVTYPNNEQLRDVVKAVGLENILLETDAPFLPPQIIRGKQNSPQHVRTIAQYVAKLLDTDLKEVSHATTTNACKVFGSKLKAKSPL